MTSSAILPHPIVPVATLPVDAKLAAALLSSLSAYAERLHGRRIWLACSGGRDSLALAALCVQLYKLGKLPFLPTLLHVDHGLQTDSDTWAQHVRRWAAAQSMPCYILRAQVIGQDEQAARQARYQTMRARMNQNDVLMLAHHADDQAETVLMRLIQGAGVTGLSGMQPWREHEQSCYNTIQRTALWRPWLSVRRARITSYATHLALPYIDDPTNEGGVNARSGLRRDIMPTLATYNPNVIDNIARSAQLLTDAQAIVTEQAAQDINHTTIEQLNYSPAQRALDIETIQTLPLYRQRQLLHSWLAQDEPLPPTKQLVDDVLSLIHRLDADHQTQLYWHARHEHYHVRRYRNQLYRLSQTWLQWLALPVLAQIITVTNEHKPQVMNLRSSEPYQWQLEVDSEVLLERIAIFVEDKHTVSTDSLTFKVAPLTRQQRVQTALATRPQAGKKLYQTLGIPVWLRDSLVVVSIIFDSSNDINDKRDHNIQNELPVLLLSPWQSWQLGIDKSAVSRESDCMSDSTIISTVTNFSKSKQQH